MEPPSPEVKKENTDKNFSIFERFRMYYNDHKDVALTIGIAITAFGIGVMISRQIASVIVKS